jgi:hypothetical protein
LKQSNPANGFLNQGCVLVHDLESMLLRDPPQNRFSTVSVRLGHFGDVGSMSGLLESGHGWAIYEYTPFCNGPVMSSLPE